SAASRSALLAQELSRPGLTAYLPGVPDTALVVNAQAFDPSGSRLAAVGVNGHLTVWDLRRTRVIVRRQASGGTGPGGAWSRDGARVYVITQQALTVLDANQLNARPTVLALSGFPLGLTALRGGGVAWYASGIGFMRLAPGSSSPSLIKTIAKP